MDAAILAIGDEIVGGLTRDSNTAFIAAALQRVDVPTVSTFGVADDEDAIVQALERALQDADLVITTGGLGPTADDLTTACVARVAGRALRLDEASLEAIRQRFRARGLEMTENNRKQALFPEGSTIVPNPTGTAPGFICPVERGGRTRFVVSLPGVPSETERMVEETVVPWAAERNPGEHFASRTFSTTGLSESRLDELLVGVLAPGEGRLAFRAAFPLVQARVTLRGRAGDDLERRLDEVEARVRERLGAHVYALGNEGMEETVGRLLRGRGATLAVAESCTGGLIGHRITEVPGSSEYFLLGVVAYSNEAKRRLLDVPEETLAAHGAVSTQTAEAMAAGVRERAGATLGLATTGIAGPGGGSEAKPVGTVCVALAWEGGSWSHAYALGSRGRGWVKAMTAQIALDRVRHWALGDLNDPTPP